MLSPLAQSLWIGLGAAVGANLRYWIGVWVNTTWPGDFPWATISVNLLGSFVIGVVGTLVGDASSPGWVKLLVVVGILGGFTTFSAFSFENLTLLRTGQLGPALGAIFLSVVGGLALCAAGFALASMIQALAIGA